MTKVKEEIVPGFTLQEFIDKFRSTRISLRRLADGAKFVSDDEELALAAHNYLRAESTLTRMLGKHDILAYSSITSHAGLSQYKEQTII